MATDEPSLGWLPDKEDQHAAEIVKFSRGYGAVTCDAPNPSDIPADLDPTWFIQKVQGVWPFCHAHMRAGIVEVLYWLATKGTVQDFSRYYAAIMDMRMDGNDSEPEGASISGSLRSSVKDGDALESLFPYPQLQPNGNVDIDAWCKQHYSNKIDATTVQDASQRHIKSVVPGIRSYANLDAALVTGRTAIGFGMTWTTGWDAIRRVDTVKSFPQGRIRGGHALMFFGWRTIAGERWPLLHNSHDGWGIKRRAALAPAVIDRLLSNNQFGAFAVTNIELKDSNPQPQSWDWVTAANFQSGEVNPFS